MSTPLRGGVGRADLLRTLGALAKAGLDEDSVVDLAAAASFFKNPQERSKVGPVLLAVDSVAANAAATGAALHGHVLPATGAAVPPLSAALFGIARVEIVGEEEKRPPGQLILLTPEQYLPRQTTALPFEPLQTSARLARRCSSALVATQEGRVVDMGRAVQLLARAQAPTRWPRRAWPYAPAHVTLWVDRSQHLRPWWQDQDQLVYLLAQWLGESKLTTYTVQGDPWNPLARWSGGHASGAAASPLASVPEDQLVLVLSDMGQLAASAGEPDRQATGAARWGQAMRLWGGRGARVLVCPPCSRELFSGPWALAWFAHAQGGGEAGRGDACQVGAGGAVPAIGHSVGHSSYHNAALERLLTLLSCARRIEPGLLRAVRKLEPGLAQEPGLEAQFWSCHAALDIGLDVCVWRPGANQAYLGKFNSAASKISPALQQAVLRAMLAAHAVRGRAIEVQELLTWAMHVDAATAQPFQSEIDEALLWLKCLPQGRNPLQDRNWVSFAAQTVAFHGQDDAFMKNYADAIGPLWGIVYTDAMRRGNVPPAPGALPAGRLAQWCNSAGEAAPTRVYQLQQQQQQLVLVGAQFEAGLAASPLGMTFSASSLSLAGVGDLAGAGRQMQRFDEHRSVLLDEEKLGQALPEAAWVVQSATQALTVAAIEPPFKAKERGRDRYGMYADLEIIPEAWPTSPPEAEKVAVVPRVPGLSVRFRYIEPGEFWLGSPETEADRGSDEGPQHRVSIRAGFWLLETACTQALWQAVMGNNPSHFNEKNKGGPAHPVEKVSWDDVQGFFGKLTELLQTADALHHDGMLTLPTEAEWEYACRAGTTTPYNFGTEINTDKVNYNGKRLWVADAPEAGNVNRGQTVPARSFAPNAWGLYQMHGNVWEWCADQWGAYGARDDERASGAVVVDPGLAVVLAPLAGGQEDRRVIRGGGWAGDAQDARSAYRARIEPAARNQDVGFRFVVRSRSQVT